MSVVHARVLAIRAALARRNLVAVAAAVVLAGAVVMAIAGPLLAPYDPNAQDLSIRLRPPLWDDGAVPGHLLGTDQLGRDLLSRLIYGARISITVGVSATLLAGTIGSAVGLAAGYLGGRVDALLMRLADLQLAFPAVLLALALVALLGSGVGYVVIVLGVTGWVTYARVVRADVMRLRTREFITYAKATGVSSFAIVCRHLLPNVAATLATVGTLQVASMIIVESSLSYLGFGIPKSTPTWGGMLNDGQLYLTTAWWVAVIPGLVITLVTLSINLVGDVLRDVADPRVYRTRRTVKVGRRTEAG